MQAGAAFQWPAIASNTLIRLRWPKVHPLEGCHVDLSMLLWVIGAIFRLEHVKAFFLPHVRARKVAATGGPLKQSRIDA
jgi:hypothetical protein